MLKKSGINKKAIAEAIADTAFALLVVFIGVIVMTTLAKMNENKRETIGQNYISNAIAENDIALYLKQPVNIDGKNLSMSDLTVLAALTGSKYKERWKEFTHNFFLVNQLKVNVKVYHQEKEVLEKTVSSPRWKAAKITSKIQDPTRWVIDLLIKDEYTLSTFFLPSPSGDLKVEIKRYYNPWT